jgi:PHP domain
LIKLKYVDKPPRDLPTTVTFPFRYNISADPDTVPWDPDFGPYNVLLEIHSHTYFSDGSMSPDQLVEWAIAYGFSAIVVSDHNTLWGGLQAKQYTEEKGYSNNTILVIPAIEYTYFLCGLWVTLDVVECI